MDTILFCMEELKELAKSDLKSARDKLMDVLCNYQDIKMYIDPGFWCLQGRRHLGSVMKYHNIHVVYTKGRDCGSVYWKRQSADRKKSSCDSCYIRCAGTGDHSGARRSAYVCFGIEKRKWFGACALKFEEKNILEKQKTDRNYLFDYLTKEAQGSLKSQAGEMPGKQEKDDYEIWENRAGDTGTAEPFIAYAGLQENKETIHVKNTGRCAGTSCARSRDFVQESVTTRSERQNGIWSGEKRNRLINMIPRFKQSRKNGCVQAICFWTVTARWQFAETNIRQLGWFYVIGEKKSVIESRSDPEEDGVVHFRCAEWAGSKAIWKN